VMARSDRTLVHRKATRAFGPGMSDPGTLQGYRSTRDHRWQHGNGSYLLVGVPTGDQTFFSTAHGSGRTMSRTKARKTWRGETLQKESWGIYVAVPPIQV